MKTSEPRNIDSYILEAKNNIFIYFFVYGILLSILFYLSYKVHFYPFFIIFLLWFLFCWIKRIQIYYRVVIVRRYITNHHLLDKLGDILFWNNDCYFLTENYFIIVVKSQVEVFSYQDISFIRKETHYFLGRNSHIDENLFITLKNGKQYQILLSSTLLTIEVQKDITEFLLEKNPHIKVEP